jgi:hypothetical protein
MEQGRLIEHRKKYVCYQQDRARGGGDLPQINLSMIINAGFDAATLIENNRDSLNALGRMEVTEAGIEMSFRSGQRHCAVSRSLGG